LPFHVHQGGIPGVHQGGIQFKAVFQAFFTAFFSRLHGVPHLVHFIQPFLFLFSATT